LGFKLAKAFIEAGRPYEKESTKYVYILQV